MNHQTQPTAYPKPAVDCRARALEDEILIEASGLERTAPDLPVALTAELWDAAGEMPFAQLGQVSLEDRVRHIVRKASAALDRARAHFGRHFSVALHHGFVLDYAVELPQPRRSGRYPFVRLHVGPDEDGEVCMTLGWPEQI